MSSKEPCWALVLRYIRDAGGPVSSARISEDLGLDRHQVRGALVRLRGEGHIERIPLGPGKAVWTVRGWNL